MNKPFAALALSLLAWVIALRSAQAERYRFDHENVLGTSLGIAISCNDLAAAQAAEARILAEIDRLAIVFSTYDADSELSRWQRTKRVATPISAELFDVLAASDRWHAASGGAFQTGVEAVSRVWREAAKLNQTPSTATLKAAAALANETHWRLDASRGTATRLSNAPLSLDGIAKGFITERALAAAMEAPEIQGALLNLGGDLRVAGDIEETIRIADPRQHAVNAPPIAVIRVANRAVATSGGYRRGFEVEGVWHSHIIDPRSGQPTAGATSATVIAADSTDADALATLCNVLPPEEALALVESTPGAAALIVTADGGQFSTTNWRAYEAATPVAFASAAVETTSAAKEVTDETSSTETAAPKAKPEGSKPKTSEAPAEKPTDSSAGLLELVVDFEINRPSGRRLRRPYVAVWLENADDFPVKTAVLWLQTERPGPRWHRDLSRWYRNEGNRKLVGLEPLIDTVASATRGPGKYQALFDGTSDDGTPLKPGKYTLFIEAAREHGTYQLIRHEMTLGSEPIADTKLKGNVEIKSASVAYRPKPVASAPAAEK